MEMKNMNFEKHHVPSYSGICRCCFEPIATGQETRLRPEGLLFHSTCVEKHPDSYYIVLERRRFSRQQRKNTLNTFLQPKRELTTQSPSKHRC